MLQLFQLKVKLEEDWKGKCKQMLASSKEQHCRELAKVKEQRDTLKDKLTQLQDKVDQLAMIKQTHKFLHFREKIPNSRP